MKFSKKSHLAKSDMSDTMNIWQHHHLLTRVDNDCESRPALETTLRPILLRLMREFTSSAALALEVLVMPNEV